MIFVFRFRCLVGRLCLELQLLLLEVYLWPSTSPDIERWNSSVMIDKSFVSRAVCSVCWFQMKMSLEVRNKPLFFFFLLCHNFEHPAAWSIRIYQSRFKNPEYCIYSKKGPPSDK